MKEFFVHEREIDEAYVQSIEKNTTEELFERMRDRRVVKYRTKTVKAGNQAYVSIYPIFREYKTVERIRKSSTKKAQEKLNDKNAIKHAVYTVNTNFSDSDLWATFTYKRVPQGIEQAQQDLRNFIRRLRYHMRKKYQKDLKCFYVTEYGEEGGEKRCHHHLITNFPSMDELEALWKHGGRTQVRRLSADEYGYEGLVRYLMKEKKKSGKRYGVTRGMSKYSVSVSDGKITRGRASKLVFGEISAKDFFEKNYPKYDFSDVEMKMAEDEYISGVYIYARLRLK